MELDQRRINIALLELDELRALRSPKALARYITERKDYDYIAIDIDVVALKKAVRFVNRFYNSPVQHSGLILPPIFLFGFEDSIPDKARDKLPRLGTFFWTVPGSYKDKTSLERCKYLEEHFTKIVKKHFQCNSGSVKKEDDNELDEVVFSSTAGDLGSYPSVYEGGLPLSVTVPDKCILVVCKKEFDKAFGLMAWRYHVFTAGEIYEGYISVYVSLTMLRVGDSVEATSEYGIENGFSITKKAVRITNKNGQAREEIIDQYILDRDAI